MVVNNIINREYRGIIFVTVCVFIIILLNIIPYYYAYIITPSDRQFIGSIFNITDACNYLAKMEQGAEGRWLSYDQYTSEVSAPSLEHIFYLVLGKVAKQAGLNNITVFFISRIFLGLILLIAIYYLFRRVFKAVFMAKAAFLFVCFFSGFGWLFPQYLESIDLWLPDAIAIERFTDMPHFLLAHILLVISIICFINFIERYQYRDIIVSGFSTLILGFILPFHVPLLYLLVFISLILLRRKKLLNKKIFSGVIVYILISIIPLIYFLLLYSSEAIFRLKAQQNYVLSPSPLSFIVGLGSLLPLAIVGFFYSFEILKKRWIATLAWLISGLVLIYSPLIFQRRFFQTAYYIPICIFAVQGVYYIFKKNDIKFKMTVLLITIIIFSGNFYAYGLVFKDSSRGSMQQYINKDNIAALEWIEQYADKDTILLSSFYTGNITPVFVDRKVYLGHPVETVNYQNKRVETENFYFQLFPLEQARDFIYDNDIGYVLYFDIEQRLRYKNPSNYQFLELVFQSGEAVVYKVIK